MTPEQALANGTKTDPKARHLAPRGTFYMLSYVAARTDKGVEGFDPGTEVHLVEVHSPTRTLVVTDGRAQVEVPPTALTNDLDMALLARRKDQANQAQIVAYQQAQQAEYDKVEKQEADYTAKDLEKRKEQQIEVAQAAQPTPQPTAPQQIQAADNAVGYNNNGYFDEGGYGYGSPFGYFVNNAAPAASGTTKSPNTTAPSAGAPNNVAAPAAGGGHSGGGHPK